jgi:recombination protein RecA
VGISREGDLIDLGVTVGIVKKLGSFFNYGELRLGQGRENAKAYLRENPELADQLEREIREAHSSGPVQVERDEEPAE